MFTDSSSTDTESSAAEDEVDPELKREKVDIVDDVNKGVIQSGNDRTDGNEAAGEDFNIFFLYFSDLCISVIRLGIREGCVGFVCDQRGRRTKQK